MEHQEWVLNSNKFLYGIGTIQTCIYFYHNCIKHITFQLLFLYYWHGNVRRCLVSDDWELLGPCKAVMCLNGLLHQTYLLLNGVLEVHLLAKDVALMSSFMLSFSRIVLQISPEIWPVIFHLSSSWIATEIYLGFVSSNTSWLRTSDCLTCSMIRVNYHRLCCLIGCIFPPHNFFAKARATSIIVSSLWSMKAHPFTITLDSSFVTSKGINFIHFREITKGL